MSLRKINKNMIDDNFVQEVDELSNNVQSVSEQLAETVEKASKIETVTTRHLATLLNIPTYDGSGQTVHPDAIYIKNGFGLKYWQYWMAITPYPSGNAAHENPSIFASFDGVNWEVPNIPTTNPVVPAPPNAAATGDHNSDAILVYNKNVLYMYYRESLKSVTPREHRIFRISSTNGFEWSEPVEVLFDNSDRADAIMSPTLVVDGANWMMWLVDGYGNLVKKTSTDGINWSANISTTTIGMPVGRNYWHVHVSKNGSRYDMLLHSAVNVGGGDSRLQYAYSTDQGITWTTSEPFIDKIYDFEKGIHYRGSLLLKEGTDNIYEMWYSARSSSLQWRSAYTVMMRIDDRLYPVQNLAKESRPTKTFRGALLQKTTPTIVPNGVLSAVDFNNVIYNENSFYDGAKPTRITIPHNVRKVRLHVGITWALNSTGYRRVGIFKNGLRTGGGSYASERKVAMDNSEATISTPIINVVNGDYFEVCVQQSSGGDLNVLNNTPQNFFSIEVIE